MTHPTDDELEAMAKRLESVSTHLPLSQPHMRDSAAMLRACKGGAVKVKPLEWHKSHMPSWNDDWHTLPTGYSVRCADENGWKWVAAGVGALGYCHSPEAAKAAAQADYERRILSAIEPAPDARQEGWNAGIEAKRDAIARGVWGTLMSDYTFDEAMTGQEQATHAKAIKWVFDVADAVIRAIQKGGE